MNAQLPDNAEIQYAVVLTSCARFDLLRRTVESFLRFADVRPRQFIVVEDSGNEKVRDALAGLDYPFEFVIRSPQSEKDRIPGGEHARQAAAIDAGYVRVQTPLVFHCEDDWLFFRGGFIRESFAILQNDPQVSTVLLRGLDFDRKLLCPATESLGDVRFHLSRPGATKFAYYYAYNPGLRRMEDYYRVAPFVKIGAEHAVSYAFGLLGFYIAHLETPACAHIGWEQRTQKEYRPSPVKNPFSYLVYKIRRLRLKRSIRTPKRELRRRFGGESK